MKAPVLSGLLAATLALAATGARAEQADCDMICRLQGYLSADHMTASPADATAPAGPPAKRRPHAVGKAAKSDPKAVTKPTRDVPKAVAADPRSETGGRSAPRADGQVSAEAFVKHEAPKSATAKTEPAQPARIAAEAPRSPVRHPEAEAPPRHRAMAMAATSATPVAAPTRPRSVVHGAPRFAGRARENTVASAALIPGSAPLVPAEFRRFGDL